eukprot:m.347553 g.347553  ORF g.347553 m.347553 type:complete len:465 (-) comp33266_c0_seq1:120-1514(-)
MCTLVSMLLLTLKVVESDMEQLPTLLNIDWQRLPDLLHQSELGLTGFQNSDGGWVNADEIVTVFGHGEGEVPFLNQSFILNVTEALTTSCRGSGSGCHGENFLWRKLPDAPVSGRQDVAATSVNGALYIVGGFSYTSPYIFADFLRLSAPDGSGGRSWKTLTPFPYPVSMHAVASIGTRVYVQGGACYDRKRFYNFFSCDGKSIPGLGKRLYMFDTADPSGGWQRLSDNPGPPRANAALSAVNGSLYLIGGMSFVPVPNSSTTDSATLVDNWQYKPETNTWTRLPDFPIASCNFQTNGPMTTFQDRYIILIGGYQYGNTYYPNGTNSKSFGSPQRMCPVRTPSTIGIGCLHNCSVNMPNKTYMDNPKGVWSHEYNNDVFVYDTQENTFGRATGSSVHDIGLILPGCGAFPINNNLPQTNILGDKIFAIGGECNDIIINGETYGHYPPLALVGKITTLGMNHSTT